MSRLKTMQNEQLDFSNEYESILLIKEVGTQRQSNEDIFSLQFYSPRQFQLKVNTLNPLQKLENKQENKKKTNFRVSTQKLKPYFTPVQKKTCSTKKQSLHTPIEIKPSFQQIKQLISLQKTRSINIDFRKFKKSIY